MYGALLLVFAGCVASAQGYSCIACQVGFPDKEFCCTDFLKDDSHYCCSQMEYYLGGFLNQQTAIIIGVVVAIVLLLFILCCCCCCACCPCYRRRQSGAVYSSVVPARGPVYQPNAVQYHSAQYPPQPASNPYPVYKSSAPPAYPTLPHPSQA